MPKPMNGKVPETSKNFGASIKRLFKSLDKWKYLFITSFMINIYNNLDILFNLINIINVFQIWNSK